MVRGDECLVETEQVIVFVRMQENGFETIEIPEYVRDAFAAKS
jgi:acyl-CoA thioesterase FadM